MPCNFLQCGMFTFDDRLKMSVASNFNCFSANVHWQITQKIVNKHSSVISRHSNRLYQLNTHTEIFEFGVKSLNR